MAFQRNIFISHSWANSGHYDTLSDWIFLQSWSVDGVPINFFNTSVPKDDPIHNAQNTTELRERIYERIAVSSIVVCPTGMYSTHSTWISRELDGANEYSVPILGVNPWGQERKSATVQSKADSVVGWTKQGVINELWRLAK